MSWIGGYVSDVRYPAFFYKEMQPAWLTAIAAFQGFVAPDIAGHFSLLELGCGQGVNLLVAAACHPHGHFVGVDFDAEHLALARATAQACGIDNAEFIHADFATFARGDHRTFDLVTCHGVWSWIAPQDRQILIEAAARGLAPGGLLYLHYMCHPGSTHLAPLQHLLNLCAHHMPGPSARKAQVGMALLEQIADADGFADGARVRRHLANMALRDPADLAHEFLTDHWQPQHCAQVHQQAGQAGLSYIGSADAFANLDVSLSVPRRMQALVARTAVPALAETLKDVARHAHQRMDLFQKGPQAAAPAGIEAIRLMALPGAPDRGPVTFTTPIGPVTGPEALFSPLLARLAAGPSSVKSLVGVASAADLGGLIQSVQLLMMQQWAHLALIVPPAAADRAERLSRRLAGQGLSLRVIPECGTAVPQAGAG